MRTAKSCLLLLLAMLVAPSMQQNGEDLDLVIVMDSSDSLGQADFDILRQSILNYIVPKMDGTNLYVGFVQYSTNLNELVNLTPDPQSLTDSVNGLTYIGGQTNTNVGLQWGLSILMTTSPRPGVAKAMIVYTDGISTFPSETDSVAEFTRQMGVTIYAVGLGSTVTQEELLRIAGDQARIVSANSVANLPEIALFEDAPATTTRPATTTTGPTTTTTRPTTTTTRPTTTTTRPTTPTTRPTTTTTRPTTTTTRPTTPSTRRTPPPTTTTRRTTTTTTRQTVTPSRSTTRNPFTRPVTTQQTVVTTTRTTTPRVTTTTRRAPPTPYVEPFLDTGLCEKATIINGVGYTAHPFEADKYVQCYFPSEARTLAVVRECPFGLLWNAHSRLCDLHLRVSLRGDPCQSGTIKSHPHEGNCRTFYNCEGCRSVPRCCPTGYLYNALSQSCVPCPGCQDPCPSMCQTVEFACNKYPVFDDTTVYRKWTKDGDVIVPCQNGTFFDLAACECVDYNTPEVCEPGIEVPFRSALTPAQNQAVSELSYEDVRLVSSAGLFDGVKSRVRVPTTPASQYDKPLVMRLTYREAEEVKEPQALASASRCVSGGLLLVSLERNNLKVEMSSYGRTPIIMRLPTAGFKTSDIKDVLLYHDRDHLTGVIISGNLVYMRRAKVAVLPYLNCGLDFGNSEWMQGFNGTMTRIQLRRCDPTDFFV